MRAAGVSLLVVFLGLEILHLPLAEEGARTASLRANRGHDPVVGGWPAPTVAAPATVARPASGRGAEPAEPTTTINSGG